MQIEPGSHLGDFGEERPELDLTFGWFKHTLRVNPDASLLQEVDFVDQAMKVDQSDPRVMVLLKDQMRLIVHADDFDEFWELTLKHRQQPDDLQKLQVALFETMAGHPTGRPGDSSPGPRTTQPKSGSEPEPPDPVMERYRGRPDLQLAVWRADQETAEQAG